MEFHETTSTSPLLTARKPSKKLIAWAMVGALAIGTACAAGCTTQSTEAAGEDTAVPIEERSDAYWAQFEPKIETLEDGRQVQRTPSATAVSIDPYHTSVNSKADDYYNTYVLNADNRGCGSCHADMEKTMQSIEHTANYIEHIPGVRMTYKSDSSCTSCHGVEGVVGKPTNMAHAHMNWPAFQEMGGSCDSCHYVQDGEYLLWDDVKYDVMRGTSDVAADSANIQVDWNQTEVTPLDEMFVETQAGHGFSNELVARGEDTYDTYMITVSGDVDNPFEMSLQEMIDTFGTETQLMTNECVLNGGGEGLIYNAEVTGIPIAKIAEYAGLHDNVNALDAIGCDGYHIPSYLDIAPNAMLVIEMNGETLNADQGYPVAMWFGSGIPGGSITRFVSEINFHEASEENDHWFAYSGVYWGTEYVWPNIGVMSDPSGIIKEAGNVNLGGYAYAFTQPVTKVEFSLDKGATWTEVPIEGADPQQWVYWNLNADLEPGAYVLQMRATCQGFEGEDVTGTVNKFLVNVR